MVGNSMKKGENQYKIICVSLLLILFFTAIVSLLCGRYNQVDFGDIVIVLESKIRNIPINQGNAEVVILELRMPRIIGAILIGAALSVSGATYQAVFANPIASPDTLGVSHAASFGAVLGIILGFSAVKIKLVAFIIGLVSVYAVYYLSARISKGKSMTVYLLLIGMIVSAIFTSLLSVLKYIADPDDQLPQITYWLMGSLSRISMYDIWIYAIIFIIGVVPLFLLRWRMNILTVSEIEAKAMGENTDILRAVAVFSATLLTSFATSITGGISWIGLIIPHLVRQIVGNDFRRILPLSGIVGAIFLLVVDDLTRIISINELPISILTSLIGAPIFFVVLIKNRRVGSEH